MKFLHTAIRAIAQVNVAAPSLHPRLLAGARVALVSIVSVLSIWLSVLLGGELGAGVFSFLFPVAVVSVWIGGLRCGILATVILALGANYYHLSPQGWATSRTADVLGLTVFTASGLLVSGLMDALQRSSSLARAVLDSIADAVITTDHNGFVRFMNPVAEALTGYRIEQVKKKPLADVLTIKDAQGSDVNVHGLAMQAMQEQRNLAVPARSFLVPVSGGQCAIDGSITAIRAGGHEVYGTVVLFRDETDRRRTEKALLEAEARYRDIFENAVVGMFQSTPEGRYLRVNRAMALMHGYGSPEEMVSAVSDIGRQEYTDPSQRVTFQHLLSGYREVRAFPVETVRRNGTRLSTIVNARVVRNAHGDVLYYEGTQEDVSERKRLQVQLEHAQRMEAVGRLAGGLAHDFNNVLGVISGYCELAEEAIADRDRTAKCVAQIRKAAEKAAGLIRQLLSFSRQHVIHPTVVDLNEVVSGLRQMLERLVKADISISFEPGDELGLVVADPGQLEQVLMNLAANARDAMPAGGSIRIETRNVDLDRDYAEQHPPAVPGPYIMLSFSDTGHGIDKSTLPHIFVPFFTTKLGEGTGLGLAMVYGIVKQNNGNIWVYSEVGHGTTFKIYLPRTDAMPKEPYSKAETLSVGGTELILIVEDEAEVLEVVVTMLEASGYKTLRANSGTAALEVVRRSTEQIDLLLTDVIMKDISGPELSAQLQRVQPAMKVLHMSGYVGKNVERYGQLDVLEKPFSKNDLLTRVRTALDRKQASE